MVLPKFKVVILGILSLGTRFSVGVGQKITTVVQVTEQEEHTSFTQETQFVNNQTTTSDGGVKVNSKELHLSPKFKITSEPKTRHYHFEITNRTAAMDGYQRPVLVINGQFPGPLIEANDGDTLKITVNNQINLPVSIHWHGLWQRGTPWMDGVTGVTQCPIPAGTSFKYVFQINGQFGTFWYHAHAQNLAADGIMGPLIVHSVNDPLKRGIDFDNDVVLMVNDWYHNLSTTILDGQLSAAGYQGSLAAPSPNSALINGIGYFNCSLAEANSTCNQQNKTLELRVAPNEKTRIRLIQGGTHALFRFSADGHTLNLTEADSTGVSGPSQIHRLPIHNGQRYSVILDTANDTIGSTFNLRAVMDTDCFAWVAPGITARAGTAMAVVKVVPKNRKRKCGCSTDINPNTQDWNDPIGGPCLDINSTLTPLIPQTIPDKRVVNTSFGTIVQQDPKNSSNTQTLGRFFVSTPNSTNSTTWKTYTHKPVLPQMLKGGRGFLNQSEIATHTLEELGWYDIIINNLDKGIDHSYHLHGVDSHIIGRGQGVLTEAASRNLTYNINNPTRRDTYVIGGGTHAIIRVYCNNPGIWIIHCHLGWHLAAGFAGVFVMQPSVLATFQEPRANRALCSGITAQNQDDTEPG
ncbi:hypothetical protein CROQUDRAFT_61647 [Cronartium quercuum f. sp. fusiforme G11]|uniref:Laccase n=1 Tax=Cronartium quercuum f. sp. fusiforme G11 TaxID=708437 RepID=A0A9P6NQ17_9BASI|nr:hypothetical protein CROQUDRAFT_61647 [Cronartium quercuum f. sp. fusiforme G11]